MARVESFELNHNLVKAPYVRLAGIEENKGTLIQKFDLRFIQPNQGALPTAAVHTLEHLLAVNMRDHLEGIIDLSPMGCRTGFYMIMWGEHTTAEVRDALVTVMKENVLKATTVPAVVPEACGNYRDHSLFAAKEYTKQVLEQGISSDPFERKL